MGHSGKRLLSPLLKKGNARAITEELGICQDCYSVDTEDSGNIHAFSINHGRNTWKAWFLHSVLSWITMGLMVRHRVK